MPVSLDEENRVAVPRSVLEEIAALDDQRSEHVHTQLLKIAEASYTSEKPVYKQYGDRKVFRCGDEMRLFGVIIEDVSVVSEFDNVVILLEVPKHDYRSADVTRAQANQLQSAFADLDSEAEFRSKLDASLFTAAEIDELL